MAADTPDPRTFQSWEDAFQYPVPVVRRLEQQLRNHLQDNREKLRNLVGASYRDLLGTAERIIEMDHDMQLVETNLSNMGRMCSSRTTDKLFMNFEKFEKIRQARDTNSNRHASQLAFLQACPDIIRRHIRKSGSLLVASKVLVISRVIHKKLAESPEVPPLVDSVRMRLASLRRKLLERIDIQLADINLDETPLLDSMVAFALATSSTPTDVLRHFHHVRLAEMKKLFEDSQDAGKSVASALQMYTKTLQDTAVIFPKRLSEGLARLKNQPLLQDPAIREIDELELEIHRRWLDESIRNYTPWPRHDELQKGEADKMLGRWAKSTFAQLLKDMKEALERSNVKSVVATRKEVLELLLSFGKRIPGLRAADALDDMRDAFTSTLTELVRRQISQLQLFYKDVADTVRSIKGEAAGTPSLWDPSTVSTPVTDGAQEFKQIIKTRSRGISAPLASTLHVCNTWCTSIEEIHSLLKQMKDTKWDTPFGDTEEDDDDFDGIQQLLSQDDPATIQEALDDALQTALKTLNEQLRTLIQEIHSREDNQAQILYLLRLLREASTLFKTSQISKTTPSFDLSLPAPLLRSLAIHVTSSPLTQLRSSLQKMTKAKQVPTRQLWEGSPPLPGQISPGVFRFLRGLSRAMGEVGGDVWARGAVGAVKGVLEGEVSGMVEEVLEQIKRGDGKVNGTKTEIEKEDGDADGEPDGDADEEPSMDTEPEAEEGEGSVADDVRKDKLIQLLFDALFLQHVFVRKQLSSTGPTSSVNGHSASSEPEQLDTVLQSLSEESGLENPQLERLRTASLDVWKRTYLLFALLA